MKLFYIAIIFFLIVFSGCGEGDPTPSNLQDQLPDEDVTDVQKDVEENDEVQIADDVKDQEEQDIEERDEMVDDEQGDEVEDTEAPDETAVIETEEDLMNAVVGKYAHYDIVAYYGDMGLMGIFKNLIISYGFTTLEVEDGKLKITDRFCHSEQLSNQDFTPTVPDSMTQAIIPESTYMEIKYDEDGKMYLWRPETPTLLGIDYPDSDNTPLPEKIKPDDPRLVDDDNDGNPGVTVFIEMMGKTEELYIARREIFAFEAYRQENGNLEGFVHDRSEQLIIDSTNFILKTQTTEWIQYEDLEKSPIFLTPVSDDYDCERLMQERDELLPPNPPVWED